jgi:hypothetical protein
MVLVIRLKTDKTPGAVATFELELKDGTKIKTCAVLERIEKVAVWYRHVNSRDLRVYDVKEVIYDGSDCDPSEDGSTAYGFKAEVSDPCVIKEKAKLIIVYKDGHREEVCGKYAGIAVYYAEYRSCTDVDADKVQSARLVSMEFRPYA